MVQRNPYTLGRAPVGMVLVGNLMSRYKQLLGIGIAGIILAVIFVPFHTASAFTVDIDLPNASPDAVPTSAVGSTFQVTIDVAPGELISLQAIELILDNNTPEVNRATYNESGQRTSGSPLLTRGNLDISIPSATSGYGYGYGIVSSGTTFSPPYSYAFSYGNAFIAGNNYGYSYAVPGANFVSGFIGPGQIVIEGKLNTAQMAVGDHTLDVVIHTGAGGNGQDQLIAPQLSFTTTGNSSIHSLDIESGSNVSSEINIPGKGKLSLLFDMLLSGGTIIIESLSPGQANNLISALFDSTNANRGTFGFGSSTASTAGDVYEIDISAITMGPDGEIIVTVPYDVSLLPSGLDESDVRLFHWTGSEWEDVTISVDTSNDTVTGSLQSLSPVVAGFVDSDVESTSPDRPSRRAGGGESFDATPSYPDWYLEANPLKRVQFRSSLFLDENGESIVGAKAGEQIMIKTMFKNYHAHDQNYALIVQVLDENGFTTDLGWQDGTLAAEEMLTLTRSWTASDQGEYKVKIFVWDGIGASPVPLSEGREMSFTVTQNVPSI